MRKLLVLPALGVCALSLMLSVPQRAAARPQYSQEFVKKYATYTGDDAAMKKAAEEIKKLADEKKCFVCHDAAEPMNKKHQSVFAVSLKEEIATQVKKKDPMAAPAALVNVRDVPTIVAALEELAKKKPAGGAETYGDLLKAGKLPEAYKAPAGAAPAAPPAAPPATPKP